jgi:hypothetical protein
MPRANLSLSTSTDAMPLLRLRTIMLRAERSGKGEDRIYSIMIQAGDAVANLSEPTVVRVSVPKSLGKVGMPARIGDPRGPK